MRLIDADAVFAEIEKFLIQAPSIDETCYNLGIIDTLRLIKDAESVDAVPVVRCRDCKFHDKYDCDPFCGYWCECANRYTASDGFCYSGRRKEDTE